MTFWGTLSLISWILMLEQCPHTNLPYCESSFLGFSPTIFFRQFTCLFCVSCVEMFSYCSRLSRFGYLHMCALTWTPCPFVLCTCTCILDRLGSGAHFYNSPYGSCSLRPRGSAYLLLFFRVLSTMTQLSWEWHALLRLTLWWSFSRRNSLLVLCSSQGWRIPLSFSVC